MRKALVFFLSALFLLAAGSAWIALYPTVPADLGGAENLDATATRVRIPVDDADSLEAWYLRGNQPAVVVLFAGYARDHRRVWRYAGFLHQRGMHVLTFDFRSARPTSRKPTTLGYWEVRDARAALDWVRTRPALSGARVGFFGESLGGATALEVAAERPEVAAVVADCPFASGDAAIADGFACVFHLPRWPLAPIARWVGQLVTGHDLGALDVTRAVRALSGRPVLLIQTRRGDRFSPEQVDRLTAALGTNGENWNVDDAKHTEAWLGHRAEYEQRVGRFFADHLGTTWTTTPAAARVSRKGH
jgi:fermentation-respiration switch protein FrsA (DUF1100 family)